MLKKHYKPVDYTERPLLEQLLFACCLENAAHDAAEQAFQKLSTGFFDLNEVRVSTVEELAEALAMLPEPKTAASNVKRALYSVFESLYSFDLEAFKKLNLGVAQQKLEKLSGVTPFALAVVTQACLGGHAIPLDRGTFDVLRIVGIATDADVEKGVVPGLERAIPKSKGVEFGSLLHQLGADLSASPFSTNLHKVLLEIAPEAKERLPKRQPKPAAKPMPAAKPARGAPPPAKAEPAAADGKQAKKPDDKGKPALAKPAEKAHDKPRDRLPEKAAEKTPEKKPGHALEKKPAPPARPTTSAKPTLPAKKVEPPTKKPSREKLAAKESPKKKSTGNPPKRKPR